MNTVTPCIHVCRLDARGICLGCFRNSDEIARWARMAESEKYIIMAALPMRIAGLGPSRSDLPLGESKTKEQT